MTALIITAVVITTVGLIVLYLIVKAAVRNGMIEAHRITTAAEPAGREPRSCGSDAEHVAHTFLTAGGYADCPGYSSFGRLV
ncbi:DUF6019 family protein [Actinoplanes sp. NPDC049265]|uniref:DUF6019 family protein n=1 Tax=Actinoplanes sp. NPDC049265 TaxID=3363902 RepID=UPI0037177E97